MWEESDMVIDGVELDFLCRYLGKFLKPNEVIEEDFTDLVYTRKKKKRATKKVSRKHAKKSKNKNRRKDKMNDNVNGLDISSSKGADTLKATSKDDEDRDINSFGGDDTLETVEKKKNSEDKKKKNKQEWIKPKRQPTIQEERKLFGKALEIMLVTCMDNHVYQFEKIIRVQNKGGPIGLKLTGEIFDCIMIDWDKQLLKKLENLKLVPELYTRFKDDI